MMPISEMLRLDELVGADGRSAVADEIGVRWGLPTGAATFWRSSANHVFSVAGSAHGPCFLRFRPVPSADGLVGGATASDLLHGLGADVAAVIRSLDGHLTEVVPTMLGPVTSMVVAAAPGDPLDVDTISVDEVTGWGAALARLHVAGRAIEATGASGTVRTSGDLGDLSDLGDVGDLSDLGDPIDSSTGGWLHGDFELDNVHWDGDVWTAFDLDGATIGPYLLDIAAAVRDLVDAAGRPNDRRHGELLAAFLAGYASVRPEEAQRFDRLPAFVAADRRKRAERLGPIAGEVLPAHAPVWARRLHGRVVDVVGEDPGAGAATKIRLPTYGEADGKVLVDLTDHDAVRVALEADEST